MALERKMADQLGASDNVVDNTNSDFSKWKVPQLKKYLQDRGISCSDHKKSTLIELCTKSDELHLPVIKTPDTYHESVQSRQTVVIKGETVKLPSVDCSDLQWSEDLTHLPDLDWPQIIVYLMENCGWTTQNIADYKNTRGYALKESNHIVEVKLHKLKDIDFLYVKATCDRQTSPSEKPYIVWMLVSDDCHIQSAGCQCTG